MSIILIIRVLPIVILMIIINCMGDKMFRNMITITIIIIMIRDAMVLAVFS